MRDVHNWTGSFLMEREQEVFIDGKHSNKVHMDSGASQVSVMGPLLFLLYINDLSDHASSTAHLLVDDCLIYRPFGIPDDQVKLEIKDLHALSSCVTSWVMKFNPSKCDIMTTRKN